jgi:hypothetical protein
MLEKVDIILPHLESKWLASLREFLHSIQSCLQLDNPGIPTLQRHHDTHVMDAILMSKLFSPSEIRRLNYCRLYLQAQTISDLTEVSGRYLDRAKYEGRFSASSSCTHGMWIHQHCPSPSEWKLWQRANLLWSDESGKLRQELGPWLYTIDKLRQSHSAYQLDTSLWIRDRQDYRLYELLWKAGEYRYIPTREWYEWQHIPNAAVPVEACGDAMGEWTVVERSTVFVLHRPVPLATFEQYVADLEPWEYDLLSRTALPTDPFSVGLALSHGVRGVSDGSVWLKQMGAFGWTMSTDLGERSAEGMGPAPGAAPNSYRSEAYGMLAMLCFLKRLAEFTYQHEPWQGALATDSLSLVDTVLGIKRKLTPTEAAASEPEPVQLPLDPLSPEWDLIVNIRRLFREMPGLSLEHVRGHQDRRVNYQQLSLMAQLNVDADEMANHFQREFGALRPHALLTADAGVHLITPKGTVTTNYKTTIRLQASYGPLLAHLQARNGWNTNTTDRINWKAHATCLHQRMKRRAHFIKLVQGILPTNHSQHRHDPSRRGCPACTCPDEDWAHILRCAHPSRVEWRAQLLEVLATTCDKWETRLGLRAILLDGIQGWLKSTDPESYQLDTAIYDDEYERLIVHQNRIGWKHIFLGRFCWEWVDLQDAHYVTRPNSTGKKRRKGAKWQVAIIGRMWDTWYLLWESRNTDLHGADARQRALVERRNALQTLRELYALRNQYEPTVRELLMADVRDHEVKSTWHIQTWLQINESIFRTSLKRVTKLATAGMRSLKSSWEKR